MVLVVAIGCGRIDSVEESSVDPELVATDTAEPLTPSRFTASIETQSAEDLEKQISGLLMSHAEDPQWLAALAEASGRIGRSLQATDLLAHSVLLDDQFSMARVRLVVSGFLNDGRLYEAIDWLEQVLGRDGQIEPSGKLAVRRILVGLLGEAQRESEIDAHVRDLIRGRMFDPALLVAVTDQSTRRFALSTIETMVARRPTDHRVKIGIAKTQLDKSEFLAAGKTVDTILKHHPGFVAAHALKFRVLTNTNQWASVEQLIENLEPSVRAELSRHPDFLIAMSDYFQQAGQLAPALRAAGQACQVRPCDVAAWSRLSQLLRSNVAGNLPEVGSASGSLQPMAANASKRVGLLLELRDHMFRYAGSDRKNAFEAFQVAKRCFDLGRYWHAEAWSAITLSLIGGEVSDAWPRPNLGEVNEFRNAVIAKLDPSTPVQEIENRLCLATDWGASPWPDLVALGTATEGSESSDASPKRNRPVERLFATIALEDRAADLGLTFQPNVGDRVQGPYVPLSQTTGCGCGVIDFDLDGWPDLCFADAGAPPKSRRGQPNRLYRNIASGFTEVASEAGCGDRGVGQSVVVGDINQDGLSDLWVMNIGGNRILINQGDGTFSDITRRAIDSLTERWSTSGGIFDFDGDGLMDLVSLTYSDIDAPVDQTCFKNGHEVTCHPLTYPPDQNEFLLGKPDGRFDRLPDSSPLMRKSHLALGLIAGADQGRSLFIANDMMQNDWFTFADGEFQDRSAASGVTVDARGLTQASMGIAASDLDNDHDLDLFVTGFAGEYNVLFERSGDGYWTDQSASANLIESSTQWVGFGTQAVDFDNDGWDELFVSNGHIGDFEGDAPPYAQPAQLYRRQPTGRYRDVAGVNAGENRYLDGRWVGRAVCVADVNCDQRSDLIVTHSTSPVALLMNQTDTPNHSIEFELVGTDATRTPIGAEITFEFDSDQDGISESKTLYQLSGNGYLSANETLMRCGVGSARQVRNVVIRWPSSQTQTISSLDSDGRYLVVQGQAPFVVP